MAPGLGQIGSALRGGGSRAASRGKWLTRWGALLVLAEIAVALKEHLENLTPGERRRLQQLVRKSRGRPSNLTARERSELGRLMKKVEPRDLARRVASSVSPTAGRRRR
jgi:hypothetical protein